MYTWQNPVVLFIVIVAAAFLIVFLAERIGYRFANGRLRAINNQFKNSEKDIENGKE